MLYRFSLHLSSLLTLCLIIPHSIDAYPIDGYPNTQIRRLVNEYRNFMEEDRKSKLKPGACKMTSDIFLQLIESDPALTKLEIDAGFQKEISRFFSGLDKNYSISILDITEGRANRYAEHRPEVGYQPGSVGKLAVMLGFFTELHRLYGSDWEAKRALMTSRFVWCGRWGIPNIHTVPFYDIESDKLVKRTVAASDNFSLYEWLDHMVSVSSNAAASIVWREALYMRIMGDAYDCAGSADIQARMTEIGKDSLSKIANDIVNLPLRKLGINKDEWRLGSFFTNGADAYVRPLGGSIGTTRGLMKFLVAMEQGKCIDVRTSLEMKRLLYMTDRRIRYAASPSLNNAKIYFKSGSLYKCKKDGSPCAKYKGSLENFMNSIAIVEREDCSTYIVALMSNVVYKNSATEHQNLAAKIDKLIASK